MKTKIRTITAALALMGGIFANQTYAGPVIIDGTDANQHGGVSNNLNTGGWLYMQKALENLAGAVNPLATKVVVDIGTTSGLARLAIVSAFELSSLSGTGGWTLLHVDGPSAITAHFSTISTLNTGILFLGTAGNATGDRTTDEVTAVNAAAAAINTFVGGAGIPAAGGALFSMAESIAEAYGWLTTLIPGIVATDVGIGGIPTAITLTGAGAAAFPGLTNADLAGADPWHGHFSGNLGGLSVLGVALQGTNTRNVIIGGGAGTVLQCGQQGQPPCPTAVPEPGTLLLLALAALGLAAFTRRRAVRPERLSKAPIVECSRLSDR